jgi:hypothetical protein
MAILRPEDAAEVVSPRDVDRLRKLRRAAQRHGQRAIEVLADIMEHALDPRDRIAAASKLLKVAGVEQTVLRVRVESEPGRVYGRAYAQIPTSELKAALRLVSGPPRTSSTASEAIVQTAVVPDKPKDGA